MRISKDQRSCVSEPREENTEREIAIEVRLVGREVVLSSSTEEPRGGSCVVRPIAATVCGSDLNGVAGIKDIGSPASVRLGHEMAGTVLRVGSDVKRVRPGDLVVLRSHKWVRNHSRWCPRAGDPRTFRCQGRGCTHHAGFSWDGAFCTSGVFPIEQLEVVPPDLVERASLDDSLPAGAVFSLVEPVSCCRSSILLMDEALASDAEDTIAGAALIIGAGPIGTIMARVLLDEGCDVVLRDAIEDREELAEWVLSDPRARRFDGSSDPRRLFRMVVITTNFIEAILEGESYVEPNGILYLLAGLAPTDRMVRDRGSRRRYEDIHRFGEWLTSQGVNGPRKLAGHSGYSDGIFNSSISWVERHSATMNRMITHSIFGMKSPELVSRFSVTQGWMVPDRSPAILAVLRGNVSLRHVGMKIALHPNGL
jgi:threonine dehydrogenase-like Zn-dependent dehydrogenase